MNHSTLTRRVSHSIYFISAETCQGKAETPDIPDALSGELCYSQDLRLTVPVVSPQAYLMARCLSLVLLCEVIRDTQAKKSRIETEEDHHADLLWRTVDPEQWRQLETW